MKIVMGSFTTLLSLSSIKFLLKNYQSSFIENQPENQAVNQFDLPGKTETHYNLQIPGPTVNF
jgi:hypothetical protein